MTDEKARIENLIREAFRGVTLGDGIGLREGCGLDDYASSIKLAEYRAQDERDNWESLSIEDLDAYSTSLSYFDAKGMRFHLPAYLMNELNGGNRTFSLMFYLTHISADDQRLRLLTRDQRSAVREFLLYMLSTFEEPKLSFERPLIEYALDEVWRD